MMNRELSAAIIAGGKSSRMGRNKALIEIDGKPIIQHIRCALGDVSSEIMIISNEPGIYDFLNLPTYSDITAHVGPLAGIITALHFCRESHCLITACDMPFLKNELLQEMAQNIESGKIVTAVSDGWIQPLCSIYPKSYLASARQAVAERKYSPLNWMKQYPLIEIPADDRSVFNINTPEDLANARRQSGSS